MILNFKASRAISKNRIIEIHCVKSVQIRNFSGLYSVRMRENTDQKKTPYLDTFHAVIFLLLEIYF